MPTESQFLSNQSLDYVNWTDDVGYQGANWSDYIRAGSYDILFAGSFTAQVLLTLVYARSWANPPAGHRYVFPVEPELTSGTGTPITSLVNPRILNVSGGMIDGGTWELGSRVTVFWEGDNGQRAYRDYVVKAWNTSVIKSRYPAWLQRISSKLASAVSNFTPGGTQTVFNFLQQSTLNQLGYFAPGGTTQRPGLLPSAATNPIGSGNGNGNGNGDTGLAKFIPWIIGGIVLFGGVL